MLLRSKSSLLNSHILHLILSLVGTLDSEHECTEIPYPEAFRDLLAGACVGEGRGGEGRIGIERNQVDSVQEVSSCMVQSTQEVCSASNTGSM